jgi:hypothetical protein
VDTFLHSGCLGDIIYALPSIVALGGGHLYYDDRPWTAPLTPKIGNLIPLLEDLPYLNGISRHSGEFIDHDFSTFRFGGLKYGEPIIARQARWVGADVDNSRSWLNAQPDQRGAGRILVNRCPRWLGFYFPWSYLVETFKSEMLFVGLMSEYKLFIQQFGVIEYLPTQDLRELAELIAACDLFIGNQSAPLAVAEGLKKPTIVEVCCYAADCFNKRPGNIHVTGGNLEFEALGKEFSYTRPEDVGLDIELDLVARAEKIRIE